MAETAAGIVKAVCDFIPFADDSDRMRVSIRDGGLVMATIFDDLNPMNEVADLGLYVLDDKYPITRTPAVGELGIPHRAADAEAYVAEHGGQVLHGSRHEHSSVAYHLDEKAGEFSTDPWDTTYVPIVCSRQYCEDLTPDELRAHVEGRLQWLNDALIYGLFNATGVQCGPTGSLAEDCCQEGPFVGEDETMAGGIKMVHDAMRRLTGEKALTAQQRMAETCMRSAWWAMRQAAPDSKPIVDAEAGLIIVFNSVASPDEATCANVYAIGEDGSVDDGAVLRWRDWCGVENYVEGVDADAVNEAVRRAHESLAPSVESSPGL